VPQGESFKDGPPFVLAGRVGIFPMGTRKRNKLMDSKSVDGYIYQHQESLNKS
jgi:hypothetical protein